MQRNKNRKTDRALFTADAMKRAVEEVPNQNRAVRDVAKDFGLSRATITRYVRHAQDARNLGSTINYKKPMWPNSHQGTKCLIPLWEPIHEEINSVVADSILGVLPKPVHQSTRKQQGIIKFGVNFEGFNMEWDYWVRL